MNLPFLQLLFVASLNSEAVIIQGVWQCLVCSPDQVQKAVDLRRGSHLNKVLLQRSWETYIFRSFQAGQVNWKVLTIYFNLMKQEGVKEFAHNQTTLTIW